jgi:ribosomal protein L11 methyltransferase
MDYIELTCKIESDQIPLVREILMQELANIGYESFVDTDNGLLAYINSRNFDAKELDNLTTLADMRIGNVHFKWDLIKDQNWNQEWENNFSPVLIDNKCFVRATFHKPNTKVQYEIVIEPKMSFGTGHHETTSLMIEQMLDLPFKNKKVLDMGCGTAILSILAAKLEASSVLAIDIDEWAYRNALENITLNDISRIKVLQGDKSNIPETEFDIILANINRNILLEDMDSYSKHLITNGTLLLSGIYNSDVTMITESAKTQNFQLSKITEKNNWCSILFQKGDFR